MRMNSTNLISTIKIEHKFKGAMLAILDEVLKIGLAYNKINTRHFPGGLRYIKFCI